MAFPRSQRIIRPNTAVYSVIDEIDGKEERPKSSNEIASRINPYDKRPESTGYLNEVAAYSKFDVGRSMFNVRFFTHPDFS